jgi:serine/threonine protein kinase
MIDGHYELIHLLGKGGSSQVFSAVDQTGNKCAIKVIRNDKQYSKERSEHFILRENIVLEKLGHHSNIVQSLGCSVDGELNYNGQVAPVFYNVLEFCSNGTLANFVKQTGSLEEQLVKLHFSQLVSAVGHLHQNMFAHMDIKLDNILLDDCFNVKLADLGTSYSVANTKGKLWLQIGTPRYMAPEIKNLTDGYYDARKADIYSLGVCLYTLATGSFPECFGSNSTALTKDSMGADSNDQKLAPNGFIFESEDQEISPELVDLLKMMLQEDPTKRPDIEEVASHPWMQVCDFERLSVELINEFQCRKEHMLQNQDSSSL